MAPAPPPTYLPDWEAMYRRGQRRNFYREQYRHPHKYEIGAKVYMQMPLVQVPLGPLYVKEHCPALYPEGPPQYILQPSMEGDQSKWVHSSERFLLPA